MRIAIYVLAFLFLCIFLNTAKASTSTQTIVTQQIYPTKLGISVPEFISFSPIVSSISTAQTSLAVLNNVVISDTRNSDNGWSVSILCSDFFAINQPVKQSGH